MTTEENKRMLALSCIVADLKAENMELVERVHQIAAEYSNAVCKPGVQEKRKDKDSSKRTMGELQLMHEQCEHLKRMNKELERFAKAIHSFVKDKKLYMAKGTLCGYMQGSPAVCSTACLECKSCLGVIEGLGVICANKLVEARVSFPNNDLQRTL